MPLIFKTEEETAEIPFLEGSKLKLKRLSTVESLKLKNDARQQGIDVDQDFSLYLAENYLVGWSGIIDEKTKKDLEFNDITRARIFNWVFRNKEAWEKFMIFINGASGN